MMFTLLLALGWLVLPGLTEVSAKEPGLDPKLAKVTARCKPASGAPRVWIFKQWHADPRIETKESGSSLELPQAANQTAIFTQLDRWISGGKLKTVVAEGCTGELTRDSQVRINGWSVGELQSKSKLPGFEGLVTSVPMKLEARHASRIRTLCGDDDAMIKEHLRAFSDVRGTFGFLSRLTQHQGDPARARTYLEGVIELYRLPKDTTVPQALSRLRLELKQAMSRLHEALDRRNDKVIGVVGTVKEPEVAVVYGGVHAKGLVKKLEEKGLPCSVVEPAGYGNDEVALLEQLDQAIAREIGGK